MELITDLLFTYILEEKYNLHHINGFMRTCKDVYNVLIDDWRWKLLFRRNFYNCELDPKFTSWYDFYAHVHSCYRALERKCTIFRINEEDFPYDTYTFFRRQTDQMITELLNLVPNIKRGDVVYLEHMQWEGKPAGIFMYDGRTIHQHPFGYDLYRKYLVINEFPIQYWDFIEPESMGWTQYLNSNVYIDLSKFEITWSGNQYTFIHEYVQYNIVLYDFRTIKELMDGSVKSVRRDWEISPGLYSKSYRTIYY